VAFPNLFGDESWKYKYGKKERLQYHMGRRTNTGLIGADVDICRPLISIIKYLSKISAVS